MHNSPSDDHGWLFTKVKGPSEIWNDFEIPEQVPEEDYQYEWLNITTGVSLLLTFVTRVPGGPAEWALYRFKLGEEVAYDISHFLGSLRVEDEPARLIRFTHDQLTGSHTL